MISDYLYEFSVIVSEGSISNAATRLNLSQSALARHLSALETTLGAKLVERKPTGVRLTEDGRYAYDAARSIADLGERLSQHFRSETMAASERQVLVGGLSASRMAREVLGSARERLAQQGALLSLRYAQPRTPVHLGRCLAEREVDVALIYRATVDGSEWGSDIVARPLFSVPCAVVVERDHAVAARSSVKIADIQGCQFGRIAGQGDNLGAMWDEFARVCGAHGFTPRCRTMGFEGTPGFDRHYPDVVWLCNSDDPCLDAFRGDDRAAIPVADIALDVCAVYRAGDELVARLFDALALPAEGDGTRL